MRQKKKKPARDTPSAARIQREGGKFFLASPSEEQIAKLAAECTGTELKSTDDLKARLRPWTKVDLFWMLGPEEQEDILGLIPKEGELTPAELGNIHRMPKTRLFDMLPEKEKKFVLTTHGWYDPDAWKKLMVRAEAEKKPENEF